MTPRVKIAIEAMVAEDLTIKDAAAAGMTPNGLGEAIKNAPVKQFYAEETARL